jgi:hypothetical protein
MWRPLIQAPLKLVRFYPNPYRLRGIEEVSIPIKSKSPPIRINPLQSIWIENNQTMPYYKLCPPYVGILSFYRKVHGMLFQQFSIKKQALIDSP